MLRGIAKIAGGKTVGPRVIYDGGNEAREDVASGREANRKAEPRANSVRESG